jgi:mandelamide amidase
MTDSPSRRDILKSSAAIAAGTALPSLGHVSSAMADPSLMSATEIVAAIRDKKISATEVAKAAIARAEQVKDLNALIILNTGPALAAAAEIDSWERPGPLPLAGLPIVVNINTVDMPTSGGTPALQNAQPGGNAPSLRKLLNAGVIMIGKANMHELAFGITSTNLSSFAGPVKNPYDKTRIPGRLFGRNSGGHRRRHRYLRSGIRHRWINPRARGTLRHRRIAAVGRQWRRRAPVRRRQHGGPDQSYARYGWPDGPHGR